MPEAPASYFATGLVAPNQPDVTGRRGDFCTTRVGSERAHALLCQPRHGSRAWYCPFTLASGSDPRHESRVTLLAPAPIYARRGGGGAETVVDVHDDDTRRAGIQHPEQRGEPAEMRAVADAGRHRDHRPFDESADNARECALHARDDDQHRGLPEPAAAAEEPVDARHTGVV